MMASFQSYCPQNPSVIKQTLSFIKLYINIQVTQNMLQILMFLGQLKMSEK
jgi:hypothetical protein